MVAQQNNIRTALHCPQLHCHATYLIDATQPQERNLAPQTAGPSATGREAHTPPCPGTQGTRWQLQLRWATSKVNPHPGLGACVLQLHQDSRNKHELQLAQETQASMHAYAKNTFLAVHRHTRSQHTGHVDPTNCNPRPLRGKARPEAPPFCALAGAEAFFQAPHTAVPILYLSCPPICVVMASHTHSSS